MNFKSNADQFSFPAISISTASGFENFVPIVFVKTENDPVNFDALNIVYPDLDKHEKINDQCRKLAVSAAQSYSRKTGSKIKIFFSRNDTSFISPGSLKTNEDALLKFINPKRNIGTYVPLLTLDAPSGLDKPFEITPDGKWIFADGCGVRIKDIPGVVLNNCYPGSDEAVYSIDFSIELKEWTLYKCRRTAVKNNFVITVEKVGRVLSVAQLNAEPNLAHILYDELDKVDICLSGAEIIVLGLPIHHGNF